jgi:uncharacterized membrane protein
MGDREEVYRQWKEERRWRATKKVVAWRVLSFTICGLVSWWYLGEFVRSATLTVMLNVLMTFVHYVFELFWD